GAFGPWTGKLDNGGEEIALRDRNDRVMDSVEYGTNGQWPSGADGSGLSLAKAGDNLDSSSPLSWRASSRLGGTPGADNFPLFQPPRIINLITAGAPWVYRADGADLGTGWK